ncbi:MAG: 4Fe-4S binding protein [Clostridiales Family XIII bacterium]|nr:4Fe-4S binding protein [Clostridiales Family XIII bacterium]
MLSVDFVGLKLRNPVIVASATPSITADAIKRAADNGAGAVVTKSVIFGDANGKPAGNNAKPRFQLYNTPNGYDPRLTEKGGMFSFFRFQEPYPTPEKMARMLDELKGPKGVDIPVIVSICGFTDNYESWRKLARLMEDAGADALELNGHAWNPVVKYSDPTIATVVKNEVKIPVIYKMMGANEDSAKVSRQLVAAGADALTGLGTFGMKAMEVDVESQKPWMEMAHGLGGTWLRAISLAFVAAMANAVDVPISGVSGIQSWEDAVKYILLGATTVQVCAAIYAKGYKVLQEIADGIEDYMKRHDYKSIEDFRGKALANIAASRVNSPPIRAVVTEKCTGCGFCKDCCMFDAIRFADKKSTISEKCDGCGVCWSLCPYKAIEMREF